MNNISRKGFLGLGGAFLAGCLTLGSRDVPMESPGKVMMGFEEMLKIPEVG